MFFKGCLRPLQLNIYILNHKSLLADYDSSCVELGYPQIKSGFYTQEPNMGNLLKKALKLGFKLIPYESTDDTDYDGKSELTINQSINSMDEFKEKLDSTLNNQQTQIPYVVLDNKK